MHAPRQRPSDPPRAPLPWVLLIPLLVYAYPAIRALLSRSEVPLILGRYSTSFFAFNVLSVGLIGWFLFAWRRGSHRMLQLGYLGLIGMSILIPMNNQLRFQLVGIAALMPALRLLSGLGCLLAEFERSRRRSGRPSPLWMAIGAIFVVLSLLDYALLGVLALSGREPEHGLRVEYDLEGVTGRDVVIVGDSFVWGEGVEVQERFGDRLEALYAAEGDPRSVYSLGETGIGPVQYAEILEELPGPPAGQVVVAFYMNDMPPPETLRRKVQEVAEAFGRGFPSARLVGDKFARLLAGDVHEYHRFVIESYREDRSGFAARWAMLEDHLDRLGPLAAEHSERPPLLLIIPLMVDFHDYPLEGAHVALAEAARGSGFEVLDLLPLFREELGDGDAYRSAPDDNHFDAGTHDLVARTLYRRISGHDLP